MLDDQGTVNAWANAEERYQAGQIVRGIVSRIAQFGVFVQVEPGIEGVIYAFELGQGPGALTRFAPGQEVQVYVKDIDAHKKRLELALENQPLPGLLAERELPAEARRKKPLDALPRMGQPLPLDKLPLPMQHFLPDIVTGHNELSCPTCQRPVQTAWKYCVYCGGTLQSRCPACGTPQPDLPDARYCCECGKLLR